MVPGIDTCTRKSTGPRRRWSSRERTSAPTVDCSDPPPPAVLRKGLQQTRTLTTTPGTGTRRSRCPRVVVLRRRFPQRHSHISVPKIDTGTPESKGHRVAVLRKGFPQTRTMVRRIDSYYPRDSRGLCRNSSVLSTAQIAKDCPEPPTLKVPGRGFLQRRTHTTMSRLDTRSLEPGGPLVAVPRKGSSQRRTRTTISRIDTRDREWSRGLLVVVLKRAFPRGLSLTVVPTLRRHPRGNPWGCRRCCVQKQPPWEATGLSLSGFRIRNAASALAPSDWTRPPRLTEVPRRSCSQGSTRALVPTETSLHRSARPAVPRGNFPRVNISLPTWSRRGCRQGNARVTVPRRSCPRRNRRGPALGRCSLEKANISVPKRGHLPGNTGTAAP